VRAEMGTTSFNTYRSLLIMTSGTKNKCCITFYFKLLMSISYFEPTTVKNLKPISRKKKNKTKTEGVWFAKHQPHRVLMLSTYARMCRTTICRRWIASAWMADHVHRPTRHSGTVRSVAPGNQAKAGMDY
jgi:hypothetical protein